MSLDSISYVDLEYHMYFAGKLNFDRQNLQIQAHFCRADLTITMSEFCRLKILTIQARIFIRDRLQDRQSIGIVFGSTSIAWDTRRVSTRRASARKCEASVFEAKVNLDHLEISLFPKDSS
jgi:hypothetical protein